MHHPSSRRYTICVRQEAGFCCVLYSVCADTEQLALLNGVASPGFSFDTFPITSMQDDACVSANPVDNSIDFVSIPESAGTCNPTGAASAAIQSRYCGIFLNAVPGLTKNAAVCDCTAPFVVEVDFNGVTDAAANAANAIQSRGE